eukprot:TRINITY_DN441_c1_g1_i5.p1 TRINITY_DN441_c1_g1~~TRINITY_DN441_c1_g1_i5.p1  ORF type:complete len:263 (-),score=46.53 TRINITY_DN441_c1_g1_i5:714-1502(-)
MGCMCRPSANPNPRVCSVLARHNGIPQAGLNEEPTVLLDPNTMSDDGTAALQGHYFTEDGSKLAYTVSMRGSDWYSIHVMDVATGKELPDRIDWCKFSSVAWNKTGTGFFYSKFPPPEGLQGKEGKSAGTEVDAVEGNKVFYHRLGTDAAEDQLVYEAGAENNKWLLSCESSDDFQTLLVRGAFLLMPGPSSGLMLRPFFMGHKSPIQNGSSVAALSLRHANVSSSAPVRLEESVSDLRGRCLPHFHAKVQVTFLRSWFGSK